jgi:hypothetical protein
VARVTTSRTATRRPGRALLIVRGATAVGAGLLVAAGAATMWAAHAFAADPSVSTPSGPFTDGQVITVSGSGFPKPSADPTGLQIIECADQGGLASNLPTDASTCDGATVNPLPVNTDASGGFSVHYAVALLTGLHGTSNIACNASSDCVLWVGVDYNQAFTSGPHAFSKPFLVGAASGSRGASSTSPESSTTVSSTTTSLTTSASGEVTVPTTTTPASAAAASGSIPSGSLASTGSPAGLPWLVGTGVALVLAGTLGRRAVRRSPA